MSASDLSSILNPTGVATHVGEKGLIAIVWTGAGLGLVLTSLRLTIRLTRMKRLLPDDYFVLAALFFLIANAILQTLQAPHLYFIVLTPFSGDLVAHTELYLHYMFVIIGFFWTVLWCIKGAFLALFWAMTDGLPSYRRWWWAMTVFSVLSYGGCWIASACTCHPPSSYFKFAECIKPVDQRGSVISISYSTTVDILTDLMIMAFALRIVWTTKITFRQKMGLGVIFSFGCIIIAFAVVRAVNITGQAYTDPAGLAVWSVTESSISVIVGCLPPFKTFLSRSNSTYASRYPPNYSLSAPSARQKRSWAHNTSSSEVPLEPDPYPQYEMHTRNVQVSSGPNQERPSHEGGIHVVKEFSFMHQ